MTIIIHGPAELRAWAGRELGVSDWTSVQQPAVDTFADLTGDHQWIHVDVERAKDTPFGGTIAHGYLTLSLMAWAGGELMHVPDAKMGINYGLDRVRFPAPLPVGAQWRVGGELLEVTDVPGGVQVKTKFTVEVKDQEKPACVAETLARIYG
jgi:acyl dehydratase